MTTRRLSHLVFLEFPDEVDIYLAEGNESLGLLQPTTVIALNPPTRAYLKRRGCAAETTLPYFTNVSHARALRRSDEIVQWMRGHLVLEPNSGIPEGCIENLVFYGRLVVHHCLWVLEILHSAVSTHNPISLSACLPAFTDFSGAFIGFNERYFGTLAKAFALERRLHFKPIVLPATQSLRERTWKAISCFGGSVTYALLASMVAPLHRYHLRRLGQRHPVLFTTAANRMDVLARRIGQEDRNISMVLLRDRGNWRSLTGLIGAKTTSPFDAEVWLGLLEPSAQEDIFSRRKLEDLLRRFIHKVSRATDIFSHHGVSFADIVARKVEKGIAPLVLSLHRRAATIRLLLDILRPLVVLSAGNRDDDMITGELCSASNLPAMLITHGSHVPPKNELERIEWGEHGYRLLRSTYPSVAIQSPLAEEFLKTFPSNNQAIRTGPLIWGSPVNRERSAALRRQMLDGHLQRYVVVHAGTTKSRGSTRFHVYETADEYVQAICDLALAVESLPDVHLIVKFRPLPDLTVNDLEILVPFSDRVVLSVEEPFLDVLGFADLLVSFSSTTIEEALQNNVPVLLYGGGGRYQHVEACEVTPDADLPLSAVYWVRRREYLSNALARILATRKKPPPELFQSYVYRKEDVLSFSDILRSPVGGRSVCST